MTVSCIVSMLCPRLPPITTLILGKGRLHQEKTVRDSHVGIQFLWAAVKSTPVKTLDGKNTV